MMGNRYTSTRADDEAALEWLRLRDAGRSLGAIAEAAGVTKGAVQGQLRRIDRDYLASEGGA